MSDTVRDDSAAIRRSISGYFFERIESFEELQANNWHKDRLFRLSSENRFYLARLIAGQRVYRTSPEFVFTDALLTAQISICTGFCEMGLPYMRPVFPSGNPAGWIKVESSAGSGRLVVFEWADGRTLTHVDRRQTARIGHLLGKSHALMEGFDLPGRDAFPMCHDYELHAHWANDARRVVEGMPDIAAVLAPYLDACDGQVEFLRRRLDTPTLVVHGDLNLPNVLWSPSGEDVDTIVDFDQIGLSRAIEDLAWVVKWYGVRSDSMDALDNLVALLENYLAQRALSPAEWASLPALLSLNSGMNYNFVLKLARIAEVWPISGGDELLGKLVRDYRERSERMHALGHRLATHFVGERYAAGAPVR